MILKEKSGPDMSLSYIKGEIRSRHVTFMILKEKFGPDMSLS